MRTLISAVFLLVVIESRCGLCGVNRENIRIGGSVSPYFTGNEGATNFVDMTRSERLATITFLREKAGAASKLLFFEVSRSGQFTPIDSSENIDAQLRSCALTSEDVTRVKEAVIRAMDPDRIPERGKTKPGEKVKSGGGSQIGLILNSSVYDIDVASLYRYEMKGDEQLYRAACCLILSPSAPKRQTH